MLNSFDTSVKRPKDFSGERGKKFIVDSMLMDVTYSLDEMQDYFGSIMVVTFDRNNDPLLNELQADGYLDMTEEFGNIFCTKKVEYPLNEMAEPSANDGGAATINNLISRGNRDLEVEDWESAAKSFEKALDISFPNKAAIIGTLQTILKCKKAEDLKKVLETHDYSTNKQVVRYVNYLDGDDFRRLNFALYRVKSAKSCTIENEELACLENVDDPDAFPIVIKIPHFTVPYGITRFEPAYARTQLKKCLIKDHLVELSLPYGFTEIDQRQFTDITRRWITPLQWIYIPETLQSIGAKAFYNCVNMEMVYLPDSVTQIGDSAFSNMKKLSSVVLSENLEQIPISAFSGSDSLEFIVIPSKVKKIEEDALNCKGLKALYIPAEIEFIHENAFGKEKLSLKKVVIYSDNKTNMSESYAFDYFTQHFPDIEIQFQALPKGKRIQLANQRRVRERYRDERRWPCDNEDIPKEKNELPVASADTSMSTGQAPSSPVREESPNTEQIDTQKKVEQIKAQINAVGSQISIGNTSMEKCPRCYSYMEAIGERTGGFSGKKAAIGGAIAGPVGLFAGLFGKRKISYRCPKCGYTTEK